MYHLLENFLCSGDIGWCCIKKTAMQTTSLIYQNIADIGLSVWSYLLSVGKVIGDYVSGENMN